MELAMLRAHVGDERYEEACRWAWATAAGTGRLSRQDPDVGWPNEVLDVPHDVETLIWEENDLQWRDRVALMAELYRQMPCYSTLMYAGIWLREMDAEAVEAFWALLRTLLDDPDDRLADPAAYWLWSGPFEASPRESERAWRELMRPPVTERRLERLLEHSGPVPYEFKRRLYDELEDDERWHRWILDSLLGSAFDVFGRVDARDAERRLRRLRIAGSEEEIRRLRERLGD